MRKLAATVATVLTVILLAGGSAASAPAAVQAKKHKLPKDVCALLTDAQVATLVLSATGTPTEGTPNEVGCSWRDESATTTNLNSLNVNVTKLPISLADLKLALKAEAKDPGYKIIKHLGSFASQHSPIPPNSEVKVLIGKLLLDVEFSGNGPATRDEKAKTLAIAKALAKRV